MTNNVFFSIALIVPFLFLRDRFAISLFAVIPVIETAQIVTTGATITKLISIFFGIIFATEIISQNKFFFNHGFSYLLSFFITVMLSSLIALTSMNFWPIIDWKYAVVISKNLVPVSILLFTTVFYLFIRARGLPFIVKNLSVASKSISISIIILSSLYTL